MTSVSDRVLIHKLYKKTSETCKSEKQTFLRQTKPLTVPYEK